MKPFIRILAATAAVGALGAGLAVAQGRPHDGPGGFGGFGHGPLDFAAIDTNGDGSLSRAELTTRAATRIAVVDVDGDGQVTRAEIIAAMPARGGLRHVFSVDPAEAMADRMLAMHGATATGAVAATVLSDQRVNMLLTALDTDRDDAVSQAEAAQADAGGRRHGRGRHHGSEGGPQL